VTAGPGKPLPPQQQGGEREPFLARWSRRKEEARREAPVAQEKPADSDVLPELPPVERLTMESDYRGFFHPKVSEDLRRAALRKLFSDPHFNVMDGLDVYIDDYSKSEPVPAAMLAALKQAQRILECARQRREMPAAGEPPAQVAPVQATDAAAERLEAHADRSHRAPEPAPARVDVRTKP
jgi:hypothetical protein